MSMFRFSHRARQGSARGQGKEGTDGTDCAVSWSGGKKLGKREKSQFDSMSEYWGGWLAGQTKTWAPNGKETSNRLRHLLSASRIGCPRRITTREMETGAECKSKILFFPFPLPRKQSRSGRANIGPRISELFESSTVRSKEPCSSSRLARRAPGPPAVTSSIQISRPNRVSFNRHRALTWVDQTRLHLLTVICKKGSTSQLGTHTHTHSRTFANHCLGQKHQPARHLVFIGQPNHTMPRC
ncbi:hypothetical protein LY78DRAFT_427026 [Colletotrichum sublineola]|nr:hypothetical protein LY78DRAFT_427026 [Colletotrichum sublineola]